MSKDMASADGGGALDEVAARHGIGRDAAEAMLRAVVAGGGGMAQFNIAELGGPGQWMRGGMTMVGAMFDNELRAKVDRLATELATLYFDPPFTLQRAMASSEAGPAGTDTGAPRSGGGQSPGQSQWQGSGSFQSQGSGVSGAGGGPGGNWWPDGLGHPASAGGQNDSRYAYFPSAHRLALQRNGGAVELYDTTGYEISGVSQQQSGFGAATFTGPAGPVPLDRLPRVGAGTEAASSQPKATADAAPTSAEPAAADEAGPPTPRTGSQDTSAAPAPRAAEPAAARRPAHADILDALERLGTLKEKGILSDAEFAEKKRELLARL